MRTCLSAIVIWIICLGGCGKETTSPGSNIASATGKAGSLARFAIVGDYLYALDNTDIVCYDISQGNNPVFKNRIKVNFDIETIYPYNDKLFIGSQTGMYAYSLADPANPVQLSVVTHVRSCDPVAVQGNYAYVTLRSGTVCGGSNLMNVYNVTNLSSPVLVKTINMNSPNGLGINNNALYVTNPAGIKIFNISQPDNPIAVSDIPEPSATDVIPYYNTLLVQLSKGTALYDISTPLTPTFISRINQ